MIMKTKHIYHQLFILVMLLFVTTLVTAHELTSDSASADVNDAKISKVFDQVIPNIPGKSLKAVVVEYGPNGETPAHTHAKSAFIFAYVLEGAIESQVNNRPVKTYTSGQSFSENPGDFHAISKNASGDTNAKLLAVFVVDSAETQLTTIHQD